MCVCVCVCVCVYVCVISFISKKSQVYSWTFSILLAANHNNCHLLCRLLVILKVIFAKSVDPDQTAPLGAV